MAPLVTVTELPGLADPKMSMSLELLTVTFEVAGDAEPKTSIALLAPLFAYIFPETRLAVRVFTPPPSEMETFEGEPVVAP